MSETRYFVGLDLGQASDYSAITVVEKVAVPMGELEPDPGRGIYRQRWERGPAVEPLLRPAMTTHLHVRHLQRWPLQTAYPAVVADVCSLVRRLPAGDATELIVDHTGVGRPIIDLLRQAGLDPVAVTIHGGDSVLHETYNEYRVPKRDLVGTLQALLQTQRLQVADALPEAATLVKELLGFQRKITVAGHDTYGAWREGAHDDILLAVALACWRAEQPQGGYESW